jgi:hypothetical protein
LNFEQTGYSIPVSRLSWFAASAALLAGSWVSAVGQRTDAFVGSRNHPLIAYGSAPTRTAVTDLNERLATGSVTLRFDSHTGYLPAVLEALDVPVSSQVLVYSQTSFQASKIKQKNPRALYFNDTVAVGWIRGADLLEVTAQDPRQGTIFYSIPQQPSERPQFGRQEHCVSCHLTWDTLGVPGPTVRTTLPRKSPDGFANSSPVDHRSPIAERWSGWFVTGAAVPAQHRGNVELVQPVPRTGPAPRLTSVTGEFDTTGYLAGTSDIVALMVLEHQAHATNLMTRLNWEARLGDESRVRAAASALADYLLFVDEAPLASRIEGNSGFAAAFAGRGPRDAKGRSLRDLALEGRLMRYPLSYTIYAPMFEALPTRARNLVIERLAAVLAGRDTSARYAHLGGETRQAVIEIVRDTLPALADALR